MAIKYDDKGNPVEVINGVPITYTKDGVIVGEGLEAVLIRGQNLKLSDPSNLLQGKYPDYYPFNAPHRHPEEDTYINFSTDPDFPPDGIPLDRIPKVIRELKKLVSSTTVVKASLASGVQDGDLVKLQANGSYAPATCPSTKADIVSGLFFNGVADTATGSVITSSTVTNDKWNLQTGKKYYLDCSRPGKLTTTDTGYFVGIAQGPHTLFLAPLADSAEALITALEQGLAKEAADRKAADSSEATTRANADTTLQNNINSLANSLNNAGGGLVKNPDGTYSLDCAAVKKCITGQGSSSSNGSSGNPKPDGSGGSSGSGGGGIASEIVQPGGGLQQNPTTGKLEIKCTDIKPCIKTTVDELVTAGTGLTLVNGQLSVDFNSMPAQKLEQVVLAMVQTGGGLSVDSSGKLYVDFSSMPTDKFDAMLKALRLPIWLTNTKNFYVIKATGSDIIDNGRGESVEHPFKTILACVRYLANNYNVGDYTANILIAPDTYIENLVLPEYSRNNGTIVLSPLTGSGYSGQVIVNNPYPRSHTVLATGGSWLLDYLTLDLRPDMSNLTGPNSFASIVCASNTAQLSLSNLIYNFAPIGSSSIPYYASLLRAIDGGILIINSSERQHYLHTTETFPSNVINVNILEAYNNGILQAGGSSISSEHVVFHVNAVADFFALANNGFIKTATSLTYKASFINDAQPEKTVRYKAMNGGKIDTGEGGQEYFPGTQAGVVESSTYSWYK